MKDIEYIKSRETEKLHIIEQDWKKFLNIIFEDKDFQVSSKIKITLVLSTTSNEIRNFQIVKFNWEKKDWEIKFTTFTLERITSFIQFLVDNISSLKEWKLSLSEIEWKDINISKKQLLDLFNNGQDWIKILKEILNNWITSEDIVNIWYRKEQLKVFDNLLNENWYKDKYKKEIWKENTKDETMWQYFFNKNDWIFWYWLDYKYLGIIQKEPRISDIQLDWTNGVISDFLLWCNNFTVLVELKKDNTPFFNESKSGQDRAMSWKLSSDLMYSVSQILGQKANWEIKSEKSNYNNEWKIITQKTINPKCFLIIWRLDNLWNKIEDEIKRKTFELFRRNSNDIEIITYDELYDRAKFIVEHISK